MASPNLKTNLTEWGLPPLIINWYKKRAITHLFEWQVECLCKNDVLFGGNLVYSAPTSAGKTLVADFLLLKRVLEYGKKALVIEPYVALTREKATGLKSMLYSTKARVGAFGGSYYTPGGMAAVSIAVCTIEKANNFINKLINENKLNDLGIVVVDEIHYLGDESRGYQLELLLTKILYHNRKQDKNNKIQIVGLSATIPNLESIAVWLNASLYITTFRPVPLIEKIKIDNNIYEATSYLQDPLCEPLEVIDRTKYAISKDFDDICLLCMDSIIEGHSTLIFCHRKKDCELMSIHLAAQIKQIGGKLKSPDPKQSEAARKLRNSLSGPKLRDVLEKLKKSPAGTDKDLEASLSFGVAFHHAGLTSEEREIIEDGFKGGAVKVLIATSTLSSGVNLPARRVIIQSPTKTFYAGGKPVTEMLDPTSYRQMIGRAGRKNMDTHGESILVCNHDSHEFAMRLLQASLGDIHSSLGYRMIASEGEPASGLKKAVLEVIANNTAKTKSCLDEYLKSTFWLSCVSKKEENEVKQAILKTTQFLAKRKFIEELKPGVYRSTRLGNAVLASGLHPDDSLELLQDLTVARQGFCLLSDLHIIYQVTPIDIPRDFNLNDWQHYSKVWNSLDEVSQAVGQLVGVSENTIIRCVQGYTASFSERQARVYKRFWIALIINDLINEIPLPEICEKYRANKSVVQQTQRAVAQFAGVMSIFCEELGYANIAALMTPLESRINFSCQRDLLDLIGLNITRPIARALFDGGYRNVIAVAKADKFDIEFIIRQTKPFKKDASFSQHDSKTPYLWVPELAMNMTTLDYASHIVDSARSYVEIEYDIVIAPAQKRKDDSDGHKEDGHGFNSDSGKVKDLNMATSNEDDIILDGQPQKRGRLENDSGITTDLECNYDNQLASTTTTSAEAEAEAENSEPEDPWIEETEMVRARGKKVPNFVIEYVDSDEREFEHFLNNWMKFDDISLNFRLSEKINEPIGGRMLKKARQRESAAKRRQSAPITMSTSVTGTSDEYEEPSGLNGSEQQVENLDLQLESQEGLEMRLDIDNKKYAVIRLYACFGDQTRVFVLDRRETLQNFQQNLMRILAVRDSNLSGSDKFIPIRLYTQDIVLTYKVLHAAFGIDQETLFKHFKWHAFDVAWWMISDCPNRGLNNKNSSLSLVSRTKYARKYHHFLHVRQSNASGGSSRGNKINLSEFRKHEDYLKFKDLVKAGKTAILKPLIEELLSELLRRNQLTSYQRAEIPARLTMAQMMIHGIGLNMKSMRQELDLYEDLLDQLNKIAKEHYAKSAISLGNIKQVARVLYQDLDLKKYLLEHSTNSDISKDPTNAEVLNILSKYHPFPRMVQDFRKIGKALEALQSVNTHARFNGPMDMMRVFGHCDFWNVTGRVSMSEPDLMLINRNFNITIPAHGRRAEEQIDCAPRRCFAPRAKWKFVAADYSQLELRLLAHFSQDANLIEILNRSLSDENHDVFRTVASRIYQKPAGEISVQNRQHAKQICYGIIYGMGNKSLAITLGVDTELADQFRQDFFQAFPKICEFSENLIDECAELGYVESLLNRRRKIDGINSEKSSLRARAERVAINTRIQSSASDIIKLAMQLVNERILSSFNNQANLVLEMHDELIYEVDPSILNDFARTLKTTMERISELEELKVNLLVNLKFGNDWSSLENFMIDD